MKKFMSLMAVVALLTLPLTARAGFNGDGNPDVVFAGPPARVCLGDGLGGFTCSDLSSGGSKDVAVGDVDGDTILDAVFADSFSTTINDRVCLGDGLGGFTCSDVSSDSRLSFGVALGDVDGDHILDAVFAINGPPRVCLGDGLGGFTCSDVSSEQAVTRGVAIAGPGPLALTDALIDTVIDLALKQGIENRLLRQLNAALGEFDDDVDDVDDVVERLDDFIAIVEAKRGKKIPEADADELIDAAEEIIVLLEAA